MSEIRKALEKENVSEEKIKEVLNILGINESKRWEPSLNETYWYIGNSFVESSRWDDSIIDGSNWLLGNVFKTEEEAVKTREKRYFLEKMKKDFEDNSDLVDWDCEQRKYYIYAHYQNEELGAGFACNVQTSGTLYTTNIEWLKQYISENETEIKKYCFGIEL